MSGNPFQGTADSATDRGRVDLAVAGVSHRTRGVGWFALTGVVADGETVTITPFVPDYAQGVGPGPSSPANNPAPIVFEFDDDSDVAAGNIAVDVSGGLDAANATTQLQAAAATALIGIGQTFLVAGDRVLFVAAGPGLVGAAVTTDAANGVVRDVTGDVKHGAPQYHIAPRVVEADDVTAGVLYVPTSFAPVVEFNVTVVDATGAVKAWDGAVAWISAGEGTVLVIDNSGAVDWAATDTVFVEFKGGNVAFDMKSVFN